MTSSTPFALELQQGITMIPVESSQIAEIGHDPESGTLAIRFASKRDGTPGSLYHYRNFGETDWQAFRDAESIGAYFGKMIKPHKDRYPYTKVDECQAPPSPADCPASAPAGVFAGDPTNVDDIVAVIRSSA